MASPISNSGGIERVNGAPLSASSATVSAATLPKTAGPTSSKMAENASALSETKPRNLSTAAKVALFPFRVVAGLVGMPLLGVGLLATGLLIAPFFILGKATGVMSGSIGGGARALRTLSNLSEQAKQQGTSKMQVLKNAASVGYGYNRDRAEKGVGYVGAFVQIFCIGPVRGPVLALALAGAGLTKFALGDKVSFQKMKDLAMADFVKLSALENQDKTLRAPYIGFIKEFLADKIDGKELQKQWLAHFEGDSSSPRTKKTYDLMKDLELKFAGGAISKEEAKLVLEQIDPRIAQIKKPYVQILDDFASNRNYDPKSCRDDLTKQFDHHNKNDWMERNIPERQFALMFRLTENELKTPEEVTQFRKDAKELAVILDPNNKLAGMIQQDKEWDALDKLAAAETDTYFLI